jgi:LysR family carnitine catabolism transcriptional activator
MNLNIHQLDAFVRVAHLGGFSRAASQLHLSQAGLSILVRKLEERLSLKLFERTTRSVALTESGRALLPFAERILADAQAILGYSQSLNVQRNGRIVLALPPLFSATILPTVLAQFHQVFPMVSVVFRECVNEEMVNHVYSRDADFALGFGIDENSELESRPLARDYLSIACSPDHPLALKKVVRWSDLSAYPLIINARGSVARNLAENVFAKMDQVLAPAYETSNHITAVSLASQSLGVAIVSSGMLVVAASMNVVVRRIQGPLIARTLQVIKRRAHELSDPAVAFLKIFSDRMVDLQLDRKN